MKKFILTIATLLFFGCTGNGVIVTFDDDKSNAIRQHFQNYLNNDMDGLKSLWSEDLQVFLNSVEPISLDELVGLLEAQHDTFSITMSCVITKILDTGLKQLVILEMILMTQQQ